jgi:UDP-2,3-diacylglucosamine pyrophosphatase LpxH
MKKHFKTLILSDTHIGSKTCVAHALHDFLQQHTFDRIIINGDFIDIWRLRRASFPRKKAVGQVHVNIIQRLLKMSKKGTRVDWILGNHDEFVEHFLHEEEDTGKFSLIGEIKIAEMGEFTSANGKRYLILHGHQFDLVTRYGRWLCFLGDMGYHTLMSVNKWYNRLRSMLGFRYWSLSKYIKVRTKRAVNFLSRFHESTMEYAQSQGFDGVMAGHIHDPCVRKTEKFIYVNSGCWTDQSNCTMILESDNALFLARWCVEKRKIECLEAIEVKGKP